MSQINYVCVSVVLLFCTSKLRAQDIALNQGVLLSNVSNAQKSAYGNSILFKNPLREIEGSTYLFDQWNNNGIIYAANGRRFSLKNINLHLKRNRFVSKISEDSIFAFNFENIKKFVINNRTFKNFNYDGKNRVYEVVYDADDYSVLKGYSVRLIEGSPNPMLNRPNDKYVRNENYYLWKNDVIIPFKLNKKYILRLVDKEKTKRVQKYVRSQNLSYKEEKHIPTILGYSKRN